MDDTQVDVFELHNRIEILEAHKELLERDINRLKGKELHYDELLKLTKMGVLINLNDADRAAWIEDFNRTYEKGTHMELFEKVSKDNPMLQDAWKKFMVALRLCGLDNKENNDG